MLSKKCTSPQSHSIACTMRILRQNIAAQKAQIMKNLELNNCDKNHLDEDIFRLQHLQKQYYQYEKEITYSDEILNRENYCLSSDDGDISSEDILKCLRSDINSISNDGRENDEKYATVTSDVNSIIRRIRYQSSSPISRSQSNNNCMCDQYFFSNSV